MCGLYTLRAPPALLKNSEFAEYATERLKVYPGENVPVIRLQADALEPSLLRWGFRPNWAPKGKAQINARAEGIETKRMFSGAFLARRCVMPADGFYEPVENSKPRRYFFFQRPAGELFYFAGIWTRFSGEGEQPHETVALITTAPNSTVAPVHGRMPVILGDQDVLPWLNAEAPRATLDRVLQDNNEKALDGWEVSGDLYKKDRQDISCIDRIPATSSLF